ncbi:MAG: excinuclease ABC subunit UvrB [Candidatus Pacebacteria bacterium]|nr:excinuclease ABC subunit UvrB [Candidatus Paceibacterota bacterium]
MSKFKLVSEYKPAGDQPKAIEALVDGLNKGQEKQTLLGVTGSGKTFTMANVINEVQKPTLVIAHNKTLAAQLAQEFEEFFPDAAVHYFVSYYDYYQPEAYVAASDTYIEKDAQINDEINKLRHATTQSLLSRDDVIIVASVSCIYGLGSPKEYLKKNFLINVGDKLSKTDIMRRLVEIHFERTTADLTPGSFRSLGNTIDIMPTSSEKIMYSIDIMAGKIDQIRIINPISGVVLETIDQILIFPAKHFITDGGKKDAAMTAIKEELDAQLKYFHDNTKILEADRLKRRTEYDLAMIREVGYCSGIENYSRHLSGKAEGEAPDTLISYFPHDENGNPEFLTIIDESHVTIPQIRAMYRGDQARKENLVHHGFRLPSAKDNRPLRFEEFEERVGQQLYVSATPSDYEKEVSEQVVEQIIRPTGLLDPIIVQHGVKATDDGAYPGQIQDFIAEAESEIAEGGRVLATTLTKKMAEDLSTYLKDKGIKAEYLHSDVKTMDRIKIITEFRKGEFDILIGVNLLREGLDMPEVTLIGILDADKAGFLRSETSLIQTIGRAARNDRGRVIVYADIMTDSLQYAIDETARRRELQMAYNKEHGITPKTIKKNIKDITERMQSEHVETVINELDTDLAAFGGNIKKLIKYKKRAMNDAVSELDFERAAIVRDQIIELEGRLSAK